MLEVIVIIISVVVLPVLINKSTENHFDWVKPYIREAWTVIVVFFTVYYLTQNFPMKVAMNLHEQWKASPWIGYLVFGFFGALIFCGYWWFTGRAFTQMRLPSLPAAATQPIPEPLKPSLPPQQPPRPQETPSLDVLFESTPGKEAFNLFNHGDTNLYLWGTKVDAGPRSMDVPRVITPGGSYHIWAQSNAAEIREKLGANGERRINLELYVSLDDKRKYVLTYQLWIRIKDGVLSIETQNLGFREEDFTPTSSLLKEDKTGQPIVSEDREVEDLQRQLENIEVDLEAHYVSWRPAGLGARDSRPLPPTEVHQQIVFLEAKKTRLLARLRVLNQKKRQFEG